MHPRRTSVSGALALLVALAFPAGAHAHAFKAWSTLVSVETGPRYNFLRLEKGTRQTPVAGAGVGITAEVNLLFSPYHPHRLSLVGGAWPTFQLNIDPPTQGVRPGLTNPLPNPHLVSYPALGCDLTLGVRYRWESGTPFVPFLEAGVYGGASKVLQPGPVHVNAGLRAGGGLEYFVLHRVAVFSSFNARGGPLLWPLPYVVPNPEGTVEMLGGVRIRAF